MISSWNYIGCPVYVTQASRVPVSHDKNKPTSSGQCHPGYEGKRCERSESRFVVTFTERQYRKCLYEKEWLANRTVASFFTDMFCHSKLSTGFHCSQGRSSTSRLPWSSQIPGCPYMNKHFLKLVVGPRLKKTMHKFRYVLLLLFSLLLPFFFVLFLRKLLYSSPATPIRDIQHQFSETSVRKTIWDLEFSEHLLKNFLLACLS